VTGISDGWYGSTMGVVVRSLGAPGTVAQLMRESQTNSERYRVHMDINSSAPTVVSVRNTQVYWMALTALTEPRTR
jgi:hypothetical protein